MRELQVSMVEKGDTAHTTTVFRMLHQQQLYGKAKTTVEKTSHDICGSVCQKGMWGNQVENGFMARWD